MRLPPQPNERIDRSQPVSFTFEGRIVEGLRGRHDRLRALRVGSAHLLAQLQVPPPPRAALLLGSLPELPDDRRRHPERPRVHDAAPAGRGRQAAERRRLAATRPDGGDRQARRPVHAAGLLLQDLHPPAEAVAAVREGAPQRGRAREARQARRARGAGRRRAPARRHGRDRRRPGRARGCHRGGGAGAVGDRRRGRPGGRRLAARRARRGRRGRGSSPTRHAAQVSRSSPRRSRSGSSSRASSPSPTATCCSRSARTTWSSRAGSSSSRSSSPATTSSA